MMLFSEIYGTYYRTVSAILRRALEGSLEKKDISDIVMEMAFDESLLTIPDALLSGRWPLLNPDCTTPLTSVPELPLTHLQKQWLKALLDDPRIQLFEVDAAGLDDVQPLFRQEWIIWFDRYTNGDPFTDSDYITHFRTILQAIRLKKQVHVTFKDRNGSLHSANVTPHILEYSEKDNRFRLVGSQDRPFTLNLANLRSVRMLDAEGEPRQESLQNERTLTLELIDQRNTLERVLLHFSHLEKETKRLDEEHYRVTLHYDARDETEILIRILSFGAVVQVVSPQSFRDLLHKRMTMQKKLSSQLFFRDTASEA